MKLVTLQVAAEMAARPSPAAVRRFITRWNRSNPDKLILCTRGRVDADTLMAAVQSQIETYTPGFRTAAALEQLARKGR